MNRRAAEKTSVIDLQLADEGRTANQAGLISSSRITEASLQRKRDSASKPQGKKIREKERSLGSASCMRNPDGARRSFGLLTSDFDARKSASSAEKDAAASTQRLIVPSADLLRRGKVEIRVAARCLYIGTGLAAGMAASQQRA